MRLKLKQLEVVGHDYTCLNIADFAEKILTEGYNQDPPLVVGRTYYGKRQVLDGALRVLALEYIAKYSACKVVPRGIECLAPNTRD